MRYDQAIENAERLLARALELRALQYGEFKLSAGGTTNYYFDGRLLTTDGESLALIVPIFLHVLAKRDIHRFGGPAVAAVPIIGAIAMQAHANGYDIKGFFARSEAKSYGMVKMLEGHITAGDRAAVWDDTINTGASLIDALDAVLEVGAKVDIALCILDRNQGGGESLNERSIPLFNIFASPHGRLEVDRETLREWFD